MHKPRVLLLASMLLVVVCLLPEEQTNSLMALYNAASGPLWTNQHNWGSASYSDPCADAWYGVTCDRQNRTVTELALAMNRLEGSLPDLRLPDLVVLYVVCSQEK